MFFYFFVICYFVIFISILFFFLSIICFIFYFFFFFMSCFSFLFFFFFFFFQAEDGIRDLTVTGVQTCALPIFQRTLHGSGVRVPTDSHAQEHCQQSRICPQLRNLGDPRACFRAMHGDYGTEPGPNWSSWPRAWNSCRGFLVRSTPRLYRTCLGGLGSPMNISLVQLGKPGRTQMLLSRGADPGKYPHPQPCRLRGRREPR